jgi:hypothetical protein
MVTIALQHRNGVFYVARADTLLLETGSLGRERFENPKDGERPQLKAADQRLAKTNRTEKA